MIGSPIAKCPLRASRVHVDEAQRSEIPGDEEHAQQKSGVANAVDDECLVRRVARRLAMEIETDQQIRTQAHALPADKHQHIVVRQDQRQHGEHEEVQISEEAVIAAFMRHVSGGINMDQHADAGDKQQPDAGERIEKKSGVGLKWSGRAVVLHVSSDGRYRCRARCRESSGRADDRAPAPQDCVYCQTAPQANRNASTIAPTQTAFTVAFCSLRPKKNMIAAPKAGKQRDQLDVV